jgi:hypothetical protein
MYYSHELIKGNSSTYHELTNYYICWYVCNVSYFIVATLLFPVNDPKITIRCTAIFRLCYCTMNVTTADWSDVTHWKLPQIADRISRRYDTPSTKFISWEATKIKETFNSRRYVKCSPRCTDFNDTIPKQILMQSSYPIRVLFKSVEKCIRHVKMFIDVLCIVCLSLNLGVRNSELFSNIAWRSGILNLIKIKWEQ